MMNMPLGSGLFDQEMQSPFGLGAGLYGQPSTNTMLQTPGMGGGGGASGTPNFNNMMPLMAMGYGLMNGSRRGNSQQSMMQGLMMHRMMSQIPYNGQG